MTNVKFSVSSVELAAKRGRVALVRLLLQHGATWVPKLLIHMCDLGQYEVVKTLHEYRNRMKGKEEEIWKAQALYFAINSLNVNLVKFLLEQYGLVCIT